MPLYEYRCEECEAQTEILQRMDDPPAEVCPKCGGSLKKLISAPAFQFKGSGWYVTDYARAGTSEDGAKAEGAAEKDGAGADTASDKSDKGSGKAPDKDATSSTSSASKDSSGSQSSSSKGSDAKPSAAGAPS